MAAFCRNAMNFTLSPKYWTNSRYYARACELQLATASGTARNASTTRRWRSGVNLWTCPGDTRAAASARIVPTTRPGWIARNASTDITDPPMSIPETRTAVDVSLQLVFGTPWRLKTLCGFNQVPVLDQNSGERFQPNWNTYCLMTSNIDVQTAH